MGWIILIVIIILIAASGNGKGNASAAGNAKKDQTPLKTQGKIDKYIALRQAQPATWERINQINEVVDDLIDEYLYFERKSPPEYRECDAIMNALDKYPWSYSGKKYSRYKGQLAEDIIRSLRTR